MNFLKIKIPSPIYAKLVTHPSNRQAKFYLFSKKIARFFIIRLLALPHLAVKFTVFDICIDNFFELDV